MQSLPEEHPGRPRTASLLPLLENRAPVRMASQFPPPGQPLGISRGQFPRHAATRLPRDPPEAFMRWLLVFPGAARVPKPKPPKNHAEPKSQKRPIEQYAHPDKKRVNNPPVGLVTPLTDPPTPTHRTYEHHPPVRPPRQATRLPPASRSPARL